MEDQWLESLQQGKCISERDLKILCEKVFTSHFTLTLRRLKKF